MESKKSKGDECLVFIIRKMGACGDCGAELLPGEFIRLLGERGALCLACSDVDHLVFVGAGDAALTRRSRRYSTLSAVVLKWSQTRKRYERQGVMVEQDALERAEAECMEDAEARSRQRTRRAEQALRLDEDYLRRFAAELRRLYPHAPAEVEHRVARHACLRSSGRVGRSAAAKSLDPDVIRLAVTAHIRHAFTRYDELLSQGMPRDDARAQIHDQLRGILAQWEA